MSRWLANLLRRIANLLDTTPSAPDKRAHPIVGKDPATLAPFPETSSGITIVPAGAAEVWLPGEWGTGPRSGNPYNFRVRKAGPYLVLALALLIASVAQAQIDPDFDDCGGKAAVVDVRWDLIDADPATQLGVEAGFTKSGKWHLKARPGDLVRAWLFVRSCDGLLGVRATAYWYDYLLDMVSWEPGPHAANVRQAPFRYSTANGGLAKGGYSQWQMSFDFTHESPTGAARRIAPGEVLDLGFLIFRVTGSNDRDGLYRVAAWDQSGYTYDYKLVGDLGAIYSDAQTSTLSLIDPSRVLPRGEFPLFAQAPPPPPTDPPAEEPAVCTADLDGDGRVGRTDLKVLGLHWGQCVDAQGRYGPCP